MPTDITPSRLQDGWDAVSPQLRVYVAGQVCVEAGNRLLRERELPGPQGRHLLAFLAAEHSRAVGTDEIADELWDGAPPAAWATSLKALVSRVRAALTAAGLDGRALLVGSPGIYRFRVPTDGWVDLDAARSATHAAEAHLAAGRLRDASGEAFVARLITARPMLPGRTGPWLERIRRDLADVRVRCLECSARVRLRRGIAAQAARDARLAVEVAPLREPSWRLLMDAHAAAGDVASALDAYERCRAALTEALGVGPSTITRERHAELLAEVE